MANRKRNIQMKFYVTEEEKRLIGEKMSQLPTPQISRHLLNCGRNKAIKSMRELNDETGIGLIEKRRQGFGKVNVIYVKTFMPEKTDEKKFGEGLEKFKKQTSRSLHFKP